MKLLIFVMMAIVVYGAPAYSATLLSDDFESCFSNGWNTSQQGSTITCSTDRAVSGTHSIMLHYFDTQVEAGPAVDKNFSSTRHINVRYWIWFSPGFVYSNKSTKWLYGPRGDGSNLEGPGCLLVTVTSSRPYFTCQGSLYPDGFYGVPYDRVTGSSTAPNTPQGQWVCVEYEAYQGTPGNSDGYMRWWRQLESESSQTLIGDLQNIPLRTPNALPWLNIAFYRERGFGDIYYDDVIITDGTRIGCGSSPPPPPPPPPPDTTPPTQVTGVTATSTSSTITLNWAASTDDTGLAGYNIEQCQGSGCTNFSQVAFSVDTTETLAGLSAGTTYRFRLKAKDLAGNVSSSYSTPLDVTTSAVATVTVAVSSNGKFTIDGMETFLQGISYYNGIDWRQADLDAIAAAGFNLIHVYLDNQSIFPLGDDSIFNSNGSLKTTQSNNIHALIQYAGSKGIVVDMAIMHADTDPLNSSNWLTTATARNNAIINALTAYCSYPNVMFDLANEHVFGAVYDTEAEMADFMTTARSVSSCVRPISYSSSEAGGAHIWNATTDAVVGATVDAEVATGINMIMPHDLRGAGDWYSRSQARATNLRAYLDSTGHVDMPVYFQEPNRRPKSPYGGGTAGAASQFLTAAQGAKAGGAAGWVFHTAAGFDLRSATFTSQLDSEELSVFNGLAAALVSTPQTDRTTLFTDNFNRADDVTLGANWASGYTSHDSLRISSNAAKALVIDPNESMVSYVGTMPNDQWAQITLGTWGGASYSESRIRLRSAAPPTRTAYECRIFRNNGAIRARIVMKPDSGPQTVLAEDQTQNWTAGDTARCEVQGTNLKFYRNDQLILSASDATYASGRVGLYAYNVGSINDTALDDFLAGGFSAALPSIVTVNADAGGADVTWSGSPASIRVTTDTTSTIEPISAFPAGRYTRAWLVGTTFACFYARDAGGTENTAAGVCDTVTVAADTDPPVRSSPLPSGTLASGTTSTTISVVTNEQSTCRFATSAGVAYASMTNNMLASSGGTFHSATVSGLSDGNAYNRYVRCQDVAGNANTSDTTIAFSVAAAPGDTTPPSQVVGLVAVALSSSQIQYTWTPSTDDSQSVAGYEIHQCSDVDCTLGGATFVLAKVVVGATGTLDGLNAATTYGVKVRAFDHAGNKGSFSAIVIAATLAGPLVDTTPPSNVAGFAGVAEDYQSIHLTWNAGTDNNGEPATSIEQCLGASCTSFRLIGVVPHVSGDELVIGGLLPNTPYRMRAKHVDAAGNVSANYSQTITVTTLSVPAGTVLGVCPCRTIR